MLVEPVVPKLDARYAYVSGVVRSLEKKMLKKADYQKMAESSPNEIRQVFQDAGYGFSEDSLDNAVLELQSFVEKNSFEKDLTDLFRLHWDYRKAALFLKRTLREEPLGDLPPWGLYPVEEFSRQMESGRSSLPESLGKAMEKAASDFELHFSAHRIDSIMEREYLSEFYGRIPKKNRYLFDYFSVVADSINLITALRYMEKGLLSDDFMEFFIPFGFIGRDRLDDIWETDRSALGGRMAATKYGKELSDAVSQALAERDFTILDNYFLMAKLDILSKSIYSAFGLEVLVAYYEKKVIEIETLRRIFRAKKSGLPEEETREVISYVL